MRLKEQWICAAALLLAATSPGFAQSSIAPGQEYSWGENIGAMNWRDADGTLGGVVVEATYLAGFIWCENAGWLSVGDGTPGGGTSYSNTDGSDHGVNIAPDGTLSGLAWGENIGWVNFDTQAALGVDRARLDAASTRFRGYAWGENVGWINLDDASYFVGVPPLNDDCLDAIAIGNGTTLGSLNGATNDGAADCGNSSASPDVWYSYTASCDGELTITTCGTHDTGGLDSGVDTVLSIHSGCPGDVGTQIACNDDWFGGACDGSDDGANRDSAITLPVTAGEEFLIRVANFDSGPTGPFTLNVDCFTPPPSNDNCVDAVAIGEGSFPYNNTGSTLDGPTDCDPNMSDDVWFLYTASADGTAVIDTCGAPDGGLTDTTLIVYGGASCPTAGDAGLACDDDTCAPASGGSAFLSEIEIPVVAGESYYVQVGGWDGGATGIGEGLLTVTLTPDVAPESDCTNGVDDDLDGLIDCDDPDCAGDPACAPCTSCVALRGDVNEDGSVNIADAISTLAFLFSGGPAPAPCLEVGDVNLDGSVNIADAVSLLNFLFSGGPPPASPGFPDEDCLTGT